MRSLDALPEQQKYKNIFNVLLDKDKET